MSHLEQSSFLFLLLCQVPPKGNAQGKKGGALSNSPQKWEINPHCVISAMLSGTKGFYTIEIVYKKLSLLYFFHLLMYHWKVTSLTLEPDLQIFKEVLSV